MTLRRLLNKADEAAEAREAEEGNTRRLEQIKIPPVEEESPVCKMEAVTTSRITDMDYSLEHLASKGIM